METAEQNQASNAANREAANKLRVRVIAVPLDSVRKAGGVDPVEDVEKGITDGKDPSASNVKPADPWSALTVAGKVIEPPFDMLSLAMLVEHSSELNQCVEAMQTNIDMMGHRFVSRIKSTKPAATDSPKQPPSGLEKAALEEHVKLQNFFNWASEESFMEFRSRQRRDLELTGNAYFEVLRDVSGNIQGFNHIPSYQMRMSKSDKPILVERKVLELQTDGSVKIVTRRVWRRFRRYVQSNAVYRASLSAVTTGSQMVWFKDFGDTRLINKHTGKVDEKVEADDRATEVIHRRIYSARSPYGLPRFVGNLLSIFGDRAAEEINYTTFRNNNVPSMMLMVSNGQLTQGSINRIKEYVESQIQGSDNYSKFLIIEGEGLTEGEDGGQVKLEAKPLTQVQQRDAMFQNYSANNQDKIRRAFRLPPIFVGRSSDYTRATAESSRRLGDEQIFAPERNEFDNIMNRILFPEMGIIYHKYKSNSPNTTDNQQLISIIASAEKTGGMTPRIARMVLEDILGIDLPPFPADFPADVPFSMTMAEAVKNKASPNEPGQQVTALKALGIIGDDYQMDFDLQNETMDSMVTKLMAMNKAMEAIWRYQALNVSDDAED